MSGNIEDIRNAVLDLLADARTFEVQPDDGGCYYELRGDHSSLRALMEAVGLDFKWGEDADDVLERTLYPDAYAERREAERLELEKQKNE